VPTIRDAPHIDPCITATMADMSLPAGRDVDSRDDLLARANLPGHSRRWRSCQVTVHATEIFAGVCPDISREIAASIAQFCREAGTP